MADLTARFKIIDDMSAKLDAIGKCGDQMIDVFEQAASAADSVFSGISSGTNGAVTSIDGVAASIVDAVDQTNNWRDALGDYDQGLLEATYSTEELVSATEEAEESSKDAVEGVAAALAAVGITAMVKEAAEAVYELADSFSDAEKTITASTGATGAELDELMGSAERVFSSSHAESLDQVAAAMSSVRTATGLVGDELERATQYGLALEDTLGYEVSQSARTASSLMKNFSLSAQEAYNLITIGAQSGADKNGDLLDVLNEYSAHYAALGLSAEEFMSSLIDGAEAGVFSVDKVGDAVKEFNIRAKDGSDTSAQAFEMLGMEAEEMSAKFAQGGEVASEAFFTVVSAINNLEDPMTKNTAAVALFGTMYEDLEANILPVLGNIEGGTLQMHDALSTITNDAKSLSDKWTEAGNSLETAFSNAVSPAITSTSETLAGFAISAGDYLQEHPMVAKAITAIGVGLGTAALAVAGYTAVTKVAIPAIHDFNMALSANPLGAVALGITAVVAAGTALVSMMDKVEDETLSMTAATRAQYLELQDLEAAYSDACDTYGETSEEASRLRYQIDDLSTSFEASRQTAEEFATQCQSVIDAHAEMVLRFEENRASLEENSTETLALIQKLSDLADGTYQTADSQAVMQAIIDDLNGSMDGLNLTYTDLLTNQDATISNLLEMAEAQAQQEIMNERLSEFVELTKSIAIEEENRKLAAEEMAAAQEWANEANADYADYLYEISKYDTTGFGALGAMFSSEAKEAEAANEELEAATAYHAEIQASIRDSEARLQELTEQFGFTTDAIADNEEATISWEDASTAAFATVQGEMELLIQAYSDVYTAALESFDGQFGLFDEASTKSDEYLNSTVENAQAALDSQLAYWESYAANIETLQGVTAEQLNITQEQYDALMSYVQDGSAEAAGLAQSMVDNIHGGNEEAVTELATTMADVAAKREEVASSTAEWVTDFSSKMNELTAKMEETVDGLNLDAEAAEAAHSTIRAYADSILANKTSAVSAATQIADAVEAALAATNARINVIVSGGTPGHADGTTYSEDVFIAGEEGPELIVGHEGSTVFPTTETDRIVNAVNSMDGVTSVTFAEELVTALARYSAYRDNSSGTILAPPERTQEATSDSRTTQARDKTIRLEIAGSGSVGIGSGTSKEEFVELLYTNLKPVLMSIVQEEIFEEGDNCYYDY